MYGAVCIFIYICMYACVGVIFLVDTILFHGIDAIMLNSRRPEVRVNEILCNTVHIHIIFTGFSPCVFF